MSNKEIEKFLKKYKDLKPDTIKKNIFHLADFILLKDKDMAHFVYFAPLILAFADGKGTKEELDLVNEVNRTMRLGYRDVSPDDGAQKIEALINENLRQFLASVEECRTNEMGLHFYEDLWKMMSEYMVACLALKKRINEEELNFLGQICAASLTNKGLSFDLNENKEEKKPEVKVKENKKEESKQSGVVYAVVTKFNISDYINTVTIDLEGVSSDLKTANEIARKAFNEDRENAVEIWDDDCDAEIEEAIKNNSPISLGWVHIEFDESETRNLFLDVVPIKYEQSLEDAYLCMVGIVEGESPKFGNEFDRGLKAIYYSKKEMMDAFNNYSYEDGYVDKNEDDLTIDVQDDLMAPYALIKFMKLSVSSREEEEPVQEEEPKQAFDGSPRYLLAQTMYDEVGVPYLTFIGYFSTEDEAYEAIKRHCREDIMHPVSWWSDQQGYIELTHIEDRPRRYYLTIIPVTVDSNRKYVCINAGVCSVKVSDPAFPDISKHESNPYYKDWNEFASRYQADFNKGYTVFDEEHKFVRTNTTETQYRLFDTTQPFFNNCFYKYVIENPYHLKTATGNFKRILNKYSLEIPVVTSVDELKEICPCLVYDESCCDRDISPYFMVLYEDDDFDEMKEKAAAAYEYIREPGEEDSDDDFIRCETPYSSPVYASSGGGYTYMCSLIMAKVSNTDIEIYSPDYFVTKKNHFFFEYEGEIYEVTIEE